MLVEDLARAFYLVLQDYERFKIDNLFVAAQAALAARTGNAANYNTHADTVRRGAMDLTQQSNYAYFPQRWKDLFEASRFASASPERLGKMLLAALPGDPQRAISSGELNGDMDTYKNARNTMNAFLGACSTVNIRPMEPDVSRAHFQLSFSERSYERNMEISASIFKRWSTAFSLIARYSTSEIDAVEIEYVGTTDLTLWLATTIPLFAHVLEFYHQLLEATDSTKKILTAVGIMKKEGHAPPSTIDVDQMLETQAANVVVAFMKSVALGAKEEQREELSGGMKVSAKLLLDDVLKGTRISVEYSRDIPPLNKDKYPDYNDGRTKELLAQNALLEMRIAEYSSSDRVFLPSNEG